MGTNVMEPEVDRTPPEEPRKRPGRWSQPGFRRAVIGAAAVILVGAGAAWYFFHGRVTTDDAQVDGHITPIASQVYGNVSQVLVLDNEHVKAGQVLLRIDPRDYQAKVAQAEAALALAEARAQAARVGVPLTQGTTRSAIAAAQAEISAAQAEYQRAQLAYQNASTAGLSYARAQVSKRQAKNSLAQANLNRMKPLVAKAEISQQQYDSYVSAAASAESDLKAAEQKLAEAQRQVEIDHAAMLAAQSQVAVAKAHLAEAHANTGQVPMKTADSHSADANVEAAQANLVAA